MNLLVRPIAVLVFLAGGFCAWADAKATVVEVSNAGGILTLTVGNVQPGVTWTATENSDWFEIISSPTGTGPGELRISYLANPASTVRSGILTITANSVSEVEIRQAPTGPWSLVVGGGTILTAPTMDGKYENNAVVEISATIDPGRKFVRWVGATSTVADVSDPTTTVTMLSDVNIAAQTEYAKPEVTGVTPASGLDTGGTQISINGKNLTAATQVLIGGNPAFNVQVAGDNVVLCRTPAHAAGTVEVTVETPGGVSNSASFTYTSTAPAAPSITQISPASGPADGGTQVTIVGANLAGATAVSFGGSPATAIAVTGANLLTCTTPAHGGGNVQVTVTTAGGTSNSLTFSYEDSGGGCSGSKSIKMGDAIANMLLGLLVAVALLAGNFALPPR